MVKATLVHPATGRTTYVFGLSEENLRRLKEGKPIHFHLEQLGGTGEVLIMYGKTEESIEAELRSAADSKKG